MHFTQVDKLYLYFGHDTTYAYKIQGILTCRISNNIHE